MRVSGVGLLAMFAVLLYAGLQLGGLGYPLFWQDEGETFDFDLNCEKGICTKADEFKMECLAVEEDDGDEKLDCTGDQLWSDYPFDWERKPTE